jgi:hypothetical protein
MADLTISSAATLTAATLATGDLIPVLDVSADAGSKGSNITAAELSKFVAISNPGVAYVRSDGDNDTAEIGNPAKPYLTGDAAWTALKALLNSTTECHSFNFGVGSFTLTLTPTEIGAGYELFFRGEGGERGTIVQIASTAAAGEVGTDGGETGDGGVGGTGDNLAVALLVDSDMSVYLEFAVAAGAGGAGGPGGTEAGSQGEGGIGGDLTGSMTLKNVTADLAGIAFGAEGVGIPMGAAGNLTATIDAQFCKLFNNTFVNAPGAGNFLDGDWVV